MGARVLDGRRLARNLRETTASRVRELRAAGRNVRLDAVIVGRSDSPAKVYAERQGESCRELGIEYRLHELAESSQYDDVAGRVLLLNQDPTTTAVMVHLPLPTAIDSYSIQRLIDPEKDVEGVNPANIGNIVYGRSSLAPCTAMATINMIESTDVDLQGKTAVVVGASNHVGKPIAVLLMRRNATVMSCNKWTEDLSGLTRRADVLVSAAGVPGLIKEDMVKPGAIVVDVGVNRVTDADGKRKTVGDVDYDAVSRVAGWVSPVPGGVGPVTVEMLLTNVVDAAARHGG